MATEDERKLFVAGLPDSMTEGALREVFEAAGGKVLSISLPKDRMTGRPRGFGFVTLATAEEATGIREKLDGSLQSGRAISVRPFSSEPPKRSVPPGDSRTDGPSAVQEPEERTLYLGNLPYEAKASDLEELFNQNSIAGAQKIHLPTSQDGRPRGFGFVSFDSRESAGRALEVLKDHEFRGRRLMVNVAHARGERGPERPSRAPRPREASPSMVPTRSASDSIPPEALDQFAEPARPVEGRRARGGERSPEPKADAKKKKSRGVRRKERPDLGRRERGGATSWHSWEDWDED